MFFVILRHSVARNSPLPLVSETEVIIEAVEIIVSQSHCVLCVLNSYSISDAKVLTFRKSSKRMPDYFQCPRATSPWLHVWSAYSTLLLTRTAATYRGFVPTIQPLRPNDSTSSSQRFNLFVPTIQLHRAFVSASEVNVVSLRDKRCQRKALVLSLKSYIAFAQKLYYFHLKAI